jgi:hypothetical protein
VRVGEPTEAALRVLVEKFGTDNLALNKKLDAMSEEERAEACNQHIEQQYKKVRFLNCPSNPDTDSWQHWIFRVIGNRCLCLRKKQARREVISRRKENRLLAHCVSM